MMVDNFKDLEQGQKITLICFGEFGFLGMTKTTFHSVENKPHYQNCPEDMNGIDLIHKPKNKRTHYRKHIDYSNNVLVYDGWLNIDINKLNYNYQDNIDSAFEYVRESKYCCFDKRFITDTLNNIKQQPIIKYNV